MLRLPCIFPINASFLGLSCIIPSTSIPANKDTIKNAYQNQATNANVSTDFAGY